VSFVEGDMMAHQARLLAGSVLSIWALLFGVALLSMASGLQGTLLGLRATSEGFTTVQIGIFMSSYYLGFLLGAGNTPKLVRKVGHPRVFAALASISSITILMHYVVLEPWFWNVMRIINGFAFAGLYVVAESWLNDMASNKIRGQLISFYMMLQYFSTAAGYALMNVASADQVILYLTVSILVSVALVPVLLSTGKTPRFDDIKKLSIKELFKNAPLGGIGSIAAGLTQSTAFTMGVIYCQKIGLSIAETTLFLAAFIIAGAVVQWPIGYLSDRLDRRVMIALMSILSVVATLFLQSFATAGASEVIVFISLYGAVSLAIYPMIVSHTNDRMKPELMIGASSTMFLVYGIAAIVGPFVCSMLMQYYGGDGFTMHLGAIHALFAVYTLYRLFSHRAVPTAEQGTFLPAFPRSLTGVSPMIKAMVRTAQKTMRYPKNKS